MLERLGTRPTPTEPKSLENKPLQAKPKPPNYSRINSTIKLVRPTIQSNVQRATVSPTLSYSAMVQSNLNNQINSNSKSTLKSTSDSQSVVAAGSSVSMVNQPFKLVPVVPPSKGYVAKPTPTVVNQAKSIHKGRVKIKAKIKSLIKRSLSPVQEDMQTEHISDATDSQPCNNTSDNVHDQQSTTRRFRNDR